MQTEPLHSSRLPLPKREGGLERLRAYLKEGAVYRREDLVDQSNAVDRHLSELVKNGDLEKLSGGLYYAPQHSSFGKVPPKEEQLVDAFLKDHDYLLFSPNCYNRLGLGTTQLYNRSVVYNHKRHGVFTLGRRTFEFRLKPRFPEKINSEYLLVDLLNNLNHLAEDGSAVIERVQKQLARFDLPRLEVMASRYGTVGTKKKIRAWLGKNIKRLDHVAP